MRLSRYVVAIVVTLLAGACAAPPERPSTAYAVKRVKTLMVNSKNEVVEAPQNGWDLHVALKVVPGAFLGNTLDPYVMLISSRFGDEFDLSLPGVEKAVAPYALPATDAALASGIAVKPSDTRFLRVGTFFYDGKSKKTVLGGGFMNAATRQGTTLLYFDRPCTVAGTSVSGGMRTTVSLRIPAAGLYWVRTDTSDPKHMKVLNDDADLRLWYIAMQ